MKFIKPNQNAAVHMASEEVNDDYDSFPPSEVVTFTL
jgi:hypothetical protein